MIHVHGGIGPGQIVGVIHVELGGLVRNLAHRAALIAVFGPQQVQGGHRYDGALCGYSSVAATVFRLQLQLAAISVLLNFRL